MLWHTLTVQQYLHKEGDPKQVLEAMNGYIKHFFGCRSCATHFVNMTQDGEAFQYVDTYQVRTFVNFTFFYFKYVIL